MADAELRKPPQGARRLDRRLLALGGFRQAEAAGCGKAGKRTCRPHGEPHGRGTGYRHQANSQRERAPGNAAVTGSRPHGRNYEGGNMKHALERIRDLAALAGSPDLTARAGKASTPARPLADVLWEAANHGLLVETYSCHATALAASPVAYVLGAAVLGLSRV